MADFLIDVGFNTAQLQKEANQFKSMSGGTQTAQGSNFSGLEKGVFGGMTKAFKALGIFSIIASLTVITEMLGFIFGI